MIEQTNIAELKGIGEKTQKLFAKVGIETVGDLIRYYPRGYDVYEEAVPIGELEEGKVQTVTGMIFGRVQVSGSRKLQVTTLMLKDLTGTLKVIWFRMPFLRNTFAKGGAVTLRGRVVSRKQVLTMEHPEIFYPSEKYEEKKDTLQPVYGLTTGLTNHMVAKAVQQALSGLFFDKGFISGNHFTLERGFSTPTLGEAQLKRQVLAASKESFLLMDYTKYGDDSMVQIVPPEGIDVLITDWHMPESVAQGFREKNVKVITAQKE